MATETIAKQNLIAGYIALTKPKIIALLVFTALGGLFLASNGYPAVDLTAFVLFGGAMAAAGANALNHYLDRDIDRHMSRTQNRPVVIGSVQPNQACPTGHGDPAHAALSQRRIARRPHGAHAGGHRLATPARR